MFKYFLFSLLCLFLLDCQHAKVRFPEINLVTEMAPPKECNKPIASQKKCTEATAIFEKEKKERAERASKVEETHLLHKPFYLVGIFPKTASLDASKLCKTGIKEIHQYTSLNNGLLETITLGIYSPQTVKITCQK